MDYAVAPPSLLKRLKRKLTHSDWFLNALSLFAANAIKLYGKTLSIEVFKDNELLENPDNLFIAGFWHGHQFLILLVAHHYKTAVMTDISWAGDLQTKILTRLGLTAVRGSSKRKGASALICMKKAVQSKHTAAFALDGPRGPKHQAKPGGIFLAQKLKLPIVPIIAESNNKWVFKNTWCEYLLPKPFSKCAVYFGKPIQESMTEHFTEEALNQRMSEYWSEVSMDFQKNQQNQTIKK